MIYVPGSGGNFKQVRSIGSVLYQKMRRDSNFSFHFNVFAVDYNEEQCAFYGGTLQQQTQFLAKSMKTIRNLYKDRRPVVIVAQSLKKHSKSMFLLFNAEIP